MVLVRPQDLSYMAGGSVAARHGVFVRRTSPAEDVAEIFARSTTAPRFDENGVVRNAAVDVPRLSWRDFDDDGVFEQAVLPIGPQTTNVIEFNIPGGTPADWELQELDGVTNLAGEFAAQVDDGDDRRYTMPANWTEDTWDFEVWAIPNFSSAAGAVHVFFEAAKDANDHIKLSYDGAGNIDLLITHGGTAKTITLSPTFAAGDEIFVGLDLSGGTATLRIDTNGDNSLNTASDATIGAIAASGWTLYFGQDRAQANEFEGAINLVFTNQGGVAPITDRFNAGAGGAIGPWSAKHGHDVILYVPHSTDGSAFTAKTEEGSAGTVVRNDTATRFDETGTIQAVAANNLRDNAFLGLRDIGVLDFDGSGDYVSLGADTSFEAQTKFTTFHVFNSRNVGAQEILVGAYSTLDNTKKTVRFVIVGANQFQVGISTDTAGGEATGSGSTTLTRDGSQWYVVMTVYDGALSGDSNRLKVYLATLADDHETIGAWGQETLSFAGASVPAATITPTTTPDLRIGGSSVATQEFDGLQDGFRFITGTAHSTAVRDTQVLRTHESSEWDHVYDFDGSAMDREGTLHGTITGATLAADGRRKAFALLEDARTNIADTDDVTTWSVSGTPVVTGSVADPAGGTGAFSVEDNDGASVEYAYYAIPSLTGDGVKSVVFVFEENTFASSGVQRLRFYDNTAAADRGSIDINAFYDGEPDISMVAGTFLAKVPLVGGYWAVFVQTTSCTAANVHRLEVRAAQTAAATGIINVYRFNVYNDPIPPLSILDASEATTEDDFTLTPDDTTPQTSTWDISFTFLGGGLELGGTEYFWAVGDTTDGMVLRSRSAGQVQCLIYYGGATQNTNIAPSTHPAIGDTVRILSRINPDGTLDTEYYVNGISVGSGTSGAATVPSSWGTSTDIELAAREGGSADSMMGLHYFQVNTGDQTAEQMDALTKPDMAGYFVNQPSDQLTVAASVETKGGALPMIDGLGGAAGIANATSVTASGESIPLPYDSALGTTIVKLESGPAGSGTRRYRFGLPGTLNGFTANTLAGMVIGVYVPASSEITPAQVTTHAVDDQASSAGDAATANDRWQWLWATRIWDAAALEAYFELRFADGVSLSGADEVVYMAIPTAVDGGVPLCPIPQATEGTSVVEAEDFYSAYDIPPGAGGLYVEAQVWAPGTLLYIGNDPTSGARLSLKVNTDRTVRIEFTDGTTTRSVDSTGTVAAGENLKALGTITATGVIQLTISVEDAAEEITAAATALALPDDWSDKRAYLGAKGGSDYATSEIIDAKIVRDPTHTLAEVEAVA